MKVSVIMPVERTGGDAERAIRSVLDQQVSFPYELIVVSASPLELPPDNRVRNVVEQDRNPATRRNRAVYVSKGELLAFIDDDATAAPDWLRQAVAYLDAHPDVLALGGPDPAPVDSTTVELISETLLAAPFLGSGIACHEGRRGIFDLTRANDIALVNLFVRASDFGGGFDEAIGYIGEDTALVERLMRDGRVVYHGDVRVFHRRRAFPGPYLRQRWRYRVKTGRMLIRGGARYRQPKVLLFLAMPLLFLAVLAIAPIAALGLLAAYYALTLILGASVTRLPWFVWPFLPFAFAAHHATYFLGICWGMLKEAVKQ